MNEGGVTLNNRKKSALRLLQCDYLNSKDIVICLKLGDKYFGPSSLSQDELRTVNQIKLNLANRLPKEDEGIGSISSNDD